MLDTETLLVKPGEALRLDERDTDGTGRLNGKSDGEEALASELKRLAKLQYKLHATGTRSLLLVLQGMDASGKDGVIKHVAGGLNPQGCEVTSFKTPSSEEVEHDFLWRYHARAPRKGRVGLFNRSHYEDVLIVRVHPELLLRAKLPSIRRPEDADAAFWRRRLDAIVAFEEQLVASGTAIVKCFLHVSRAEQRKRLLERIDEPDKNWKFAPSDVAERKRWDDYRKAYEAALSHTSKREAPWYVVPADRKWYARAAVARIAADALEAMRLELPIPTEPERAALTAARAELERDQG